MTNCFKNPLRAPRWRGAARVIALGLCSHWAVSRSHAEIGVGSLNEATPAKVGLGAVADLPCSITESFQTLLAGGRWEDLGQGQYARPSLGALSTRETTRHSLDQLLKVPGVMDSLPIPEAFSVVMWVRMSKEQKSSVLFGLGEPNGAYLAAATDSNGAPMLTFLNEGKVTQLDRAGNSPVNLADGHLHAVVALVNLGSGLVRLYIDGRPEAATTISLWRPRQFGLAFASYSLQGRTSVPGIDSVGLLMPRVVSRELTEDEIKKIKPTDQSPDEEMAAIDPELGARLAKDTLLEFWPSQYSYMLRWRP